MSAEVCANNTRSRGRPSTYTAALADEILDRLVAGQSLRAICRDDHMPAESTVRAWAHRDVNGFRDRYLTARDLGLDMLIDEMFEIADDMTRMDLLSIRKDCERIKIRQWYYAKLAPKKGGDWAQADRVGKVTIDVVYAGDLPRS